MNLQKRLAEIRHAFEHGDTPREIVEVLNENITKLLAAGVSENALKVGERAPLNLAVQTQSDTVPLKRIFKGRFLVLTWFRGNW